MDCVGTLVLGGPVVGQFFVEALSLLVLFIPHFLVLEFDQFVQLVLGELLRLDSVVFVPTFLEVLLRHVPLGCRLGSLKKDHRTLWTTTAYHDARHVERSVVDLGETRTNPADTTYPRLGVSCSFLRILVHRGRFIAVELVVTSLGYILSSEQETIRDILLLSDQLVD